MGTILYTDEQLKEAAENYRDLYIYGGGTNFKYLLRYLEKYQKDIIKHIQGVVTSDGINGGLPVNEYKYTKGLINEKDAVILAMWPHNNAEVEKMLVADGVKNIFEINYHLVHREDYDRAYDLLKGYFDDYDRGKRVGVNTPVYDTKKYAWTMWWQGEGTAPDLVKACIKNRRAFLPDDVEMVTITETNIDSYISLPTYIYEKKERGMISPAHLADIVRTCLLYKFGGVWFDAEVLLLEPFDAEIMKKEFYSRREEKGHFGSNVSWGISFLEATSGNMLFELLQELWLRYWQDYDEIALYHMLDYKIAIAANRYKIIEDMIRNVPLNNKNVDTLQLHEGEPYSFDAICKYTEGCFFSNMNHRLEGGDMGSIYEQVLLDPIGSFNKAQQIEVWKNI